VPDRGDELQSATKRALLLAGLVRRAEEDPNFELSAGEEEALLAIAGATGAPTETLNDWNVALRFCTLVAPERNRALARRVAGAIGAELLDQSPLPETIGRTAALVVLERLVLAAVAVDDRNLAHRALQRLTARIGELFLVADLGPAFLALRPVGVTLRDAAMLAFEKVDLRLAVETAEAGRMKLLSAVAAGSSHPSRAPKPEPPEVLPIPPAVVSTLLDPDPEAIRDLVENRLTDADLSAALIAMTQPWERLVSTYEATPTGNGVPDETWRQALNEPSLEWITQTLDENQLLVYPFVSERRVGMVLVASDAIVSTISEGEESISAEENSRLAGAGLAHSLAETLQQAGGRADPTDIRFVAWDPSSELAIQEISAGFWLTHDLAQAGPSRASPTMRQAPAVMPSARALAAPSNPIPSPLRTVSFLGDPTGDLAGPWLEAGGWHRQFDDRAQLHMGAAATSEALAEGLRQADLVVVSGHGFGARSDGAFGIRLADGDMTHSDLLETAGDVRASMAILSCCWAASSARGAVEVEVLGLATTLLALGVQQVLAPLVPIADNAAGVIGAIVAASLADGLDLRHALPAAIGFARESDLVRAPSSLPPILTEICPHDQADLDSSGTVDKEVYLETLGQFAVFSGGLPPRGATNHPTAN